jgi:hypothetical protein
MMNPIKDDDSAPIRCAFPGCHCSTNRHPYLVGWASLAKWGPGIPDGWYCGPHAAALDAMLESGELEDIQSGRT